MNECICTEIVMQILKRAQQTENVDTIIPVENTSIDS